MSQKLSVESACGKSKEKPIMAISPSLQLLTELDGILLGLGVYLVLSKECDAILSLCLS